MTERTMIASIVRAAAALQGLSDIEVMKIRPLIDLEVDSLKMLELFADIQKQTGKSLDDYINQRGPDFSFGDLLTKEEN